MALCFCGHDVGPDVFGAQPARGKLSILGREGVAMSPEHRAGVVTVRNSAAARRITSEWQVELRSRSGVTKVYQIKEDPRPSEGDGFLEMLAEG